MGNSSSKKSVNSSVAIFGLDAAGKTTILYGLKMSEQVITVPTIGPNVERIIIDGREMQFYDLGGQERLRPLWNTYTSLAKGVIFVVDSADRSRIDIAAAEFRHMIKCEDLKEAPVLILANKQDLVGAMTPNEIASRLRLQELQDRQWHLQGTCAIQQSGLREGVEWITRALKGVK
eukprot:TRINITY_DN10417_c0_g1_i1.p1 TRINITY_DN10417_c0_g1~~TRINITY_DN10417_c0_g1_i1.p1  ORF type:complete len:176 (+),score=22.83 TRINITY_DN10417_c0_g1_i1:71-598(+)